MDIISRLRHSRVKLLQTEAADLEKWSKLQHIKEDLELFLQFNLAELKFKSRAGVEKHIVCTSNAALIKVFSAAVHEDKKKFARFASSGIHCKEKDVVKTWDLEKNKLKSVSLKDWQIVNFITISEKNILILDEVLHKLLDK